MKPSLIMFVAAAVIILLFFIIEIEYELIPFDGLFQ
jgi:hypothetical protein